MPAYMHAMHFVARGNCFAPRRVSRKGKFTMSRLDQDTSTMRMRLEATPIELRKPEMGPQTKARGILVGALLGVAAWVAIIALGVAVWRWLS